MSFQSNSRAFNKGSFNLTCTICRTSMLIYRYQELEGSIMAITASEARANLFPLIAQVNENAKPLHITSKQGNAVLVSESEWEAMLETLYVLGNPVNAKILLDSIEDGKKGRGKVYRFDQLDDLFGARKEKKQIRKKKTAPRKKLAAKVRKRKVSN